MAGLLLWLESILYSYIIRVTQVIHIVLGGIFVTDEFICRWMLAKVNNSFIVLLISSKLLKNTRKWLYKHFEITFLILSRNEHTKFTIK